MLHDNMTALEIADYLYALKSSGRDLLKMHSNILKMIGEMSGLEVTHRKYASKNHSYTKTAVDNKRQEIFKAIRLYEQYVLMQKLMS